MSRAFSFACAEGVSEVFETSETDSPEEANHGVRYIRGVADLPGAYLVSVPVEAAVRPLAAAIVAAGGRLS